MAKSKSRATRFEEALAKVEGPKNEVEELRDELQDWLDNMPENLQGGTKAGELETAIDLLEELISNLEDCAFTEVIFPGMF